MPIKIQGFSYLLVNRAILFENIEHTVTYCISAGEICAKYTVLKETPIK